MLCCTIPLVLAACTASRSLPGTIADGPHQRLADSIRATLTGPVATPLVESEALASHAVSEGSIRGVVVDGDSGVPINHGLVFLSPSFGTQTDSLGRFQLRNVPAGSYTLTAQRIGYSSTSLEVEMPQSSGVAARFVLRPESLSNCGLIISWPGVTAVVRDGVSGGAPTGLTSLRLAKEAWESTSAETAEPDWEALPLRVRVPSDGVFELEVSADGYAPWHGRVALSSDSCGTIGQAVVPVWLLPL
jgi:hypothetical protein